MITLNFENLLIAALLFLLFLFLFRHQKKRTPPLLFLSSINEFDTPEKSFKVRHVLLPFHLLFASVFFFFAALPDFSLYLPARMATTQAPKEGLAIFLVVDRSSSMAKSLPDLELVTTRFIEERPNDLFGLTAFSRRAEILSPLTLDHNFVIQKLHTIRAVQDPKESASSIGYALYKTANMIDSLLSFSKEKKADNYEIKAPIIFLLTDGFQYIHPEDKENPLRSLTLEESGKFLKEKGITLYILNVNREFNLDTYDAHRRIMQDVATFTGGELFVVSDEKNLQSFYQDLETREKSIFQPPAVWGTTKKETRNGFLMAGLICLVAAIVLQTTWLRKVP